MARCSMLSATPSSDDWIPGCIWPANAIVAKHGGRYLARTDAHEQIEGDADPAALRIIIERPSKDAALAFMIDPDYAPHLKRRTEGSKSLHFLVEAKDDLAS